MKFPDDFNVEKEHGWTLSNINYMHSINYDVAPKFSHYNRQTKRLSGKTYLKIHVKKDSLIQYFEDSGFAYDDMSVNRFNRPIAHYAPISQQNLDIFVNEMLKNFQKIIKLRYPHSTGSLFLFDEPVPVCHVFTKKPQEYVPEFDYVPNLSSDSDSKADDKEEQGPLAPNNHLKAEHLLQARLQQDNDHDDDNNSEQVKPSTPPKPDNNDNSSALQQAVKQQTDAIDEEEKAHQKSLLANATHSNDDAQSKSAYADLLRRQDEEKARLDALNADTKRKMKENRQRRNNNRNRNNQRQHDADDGLDK